MRIVYMHTLEGKPATYNGEQIVAVDSRTAIKLVPTLSKLRREQRDSESWRKQQGFTSFDERHPRSLGYCRVIA